MGRFNSVFYGSGAMGDLNGANHYANTGQKTPQGGGNFAAHGQAPQHSGGSPFSAARQRAQQQAASRGMSPDQGFSMDRDGNLLNARQGGVQSHGQAQGLMAPNPGESQQQFDGRVNQHIQGLKDRGSNPAWYGFGPQHDTGRPMSGGAYAASSPGQAQPQQQSQGTPYNPQQGQNFAGFGSQQGGPFSAWNPNNANDSQAPRPPASQAQAFQFGGTQPPGQAPGPQGPPFSHPLAQHLPAFQFRATDFMGNQFNNPGAFTAQQGATAHALNQQRTQQILNMFTNGAPLGGLNPMAAYYQGQQMLQG